MKKVVSDWVSTNIILWQRKSKFLLDFTLNSCIMLGSKISYIRAIFWWFSLTIDYQWVMIYWWYTRPTGHWLSMSYRWKSYFFTFFWFLWKKSLQWIKIYVKISLQSHGSSKWSITLKLLKWMRKLKRLLWQQIVVKSRCLLTASV